MPDVFRTISPILTKQIRNFAKSLEVWLRNSLRGFPEEIIRTKITAVGVFVQKLRRYTGLNHLAQAARSVLANPQHITQMASDYARVDFANILDQVLWICPHGNAANITAIEARFREMLATGALEQWAVWLQSVVRDGLGEQIPQAAANEFLLHWSFARYLHFNC